MVSATQFESEISTASRCVRSSCDSMTKEEKHDVEEGNKESKRKGGERESLLLTYWYFLHQNWRVQYYDLCMR